MQESVGARIKRLRKERGISLRNLAEELGVSHATVARYETDDFSPKRKAQRIADIFKVSLDYLMTGNGDPTAQSITGKGMSLTLDERQFLWRFRCLDERAKMTVLDLIDREVALYRAYK